MEKDVYERYLQLANLANLHSTEDIATEASTLGVLYPVRIFSCEQPLQYHTTWAIELLILWKGNARACKWDKRVEHPRLSFSLITNG